MLEKVLLLCTLAGGAQLLAQATEVTGPGIPNTINNLTATGALIFLVIYLVTKIIPGMNQAAAAERAAAQAAADAQREADRQAFKCAGSPKQ